MYLTHKDLSRYVVLDLEANGLHPDRIWCGVAKNAATKETWRLRSDTEVKRFVEDAPASTIWVGHNFLSYDAPTTNRLLGTRIRVGNVVDTLILSYLYDPHIENGHALGDWATRLHVPPKDEFNDFSQFSERLLERCATDVDITLEVFLRLTEKMRSIGYSEESCSIEHEIRHIVNKQQRNGFFFDIPGAERLLGQLRQRQANLSDPIQKLFPPTLAQVKEFTYKTKADGTPYQSYSRHVNAYPKVTRSDDGTYQCFDWMEFNIGSPLQRVEKLLSLGWKPTKFTKKTKNGGGGNPQVDEESLVEFAKESGIAEVQMIADWLVEFGRGNMVQTWLDHVNRADSRIHGEIFTCGAQSRRMIHKEPNTANIPSNEAKYGKECRSLWQASPGRVLVGYDAKALQMRIFGHYLGNPDVAKVYIEGDPHQRNSDAIGEGVGRKPAKNLFYAFIFGAQDPKLGKMVGRDKTFGGFIRKRLYQSTPGLEALVERSQKEFKNGGRLRCLDGGYVVCPSEHAALNYYIQPGEVCIMKKAAIFLDSALRKAGVDHLKVGDIHDEAQHETDPGAARELGELSQACIRDAGEHFNLTVPMAGDYKIGRTWAETH